MGKGRRLGPFYPVVTREDYKELTAERIKEIRLSRGQTQAQFALDVTEIVRRWSGLGTTPVQSQSIQHYEVGRAKPGPLIGVAILVLSEGKRE